VNVERRLLVAVTMSATYPPRRGNQIRTSSLLSRLGSHWDVESYSLTFQRSDLPLPRREHRATRRWVDRRTRDPLATAWMLAFGWFGKPPVGLASALWAWPRGHIVRALRRADAILVSPPYHFDWVRRHAPASTPIVFDEHSLEADLYRGDDSRAGRAVLRAVERAERSAASGADLVFVTSEEDGQAVRALGAARVAIVPNGVDLQRFARPATVDVRSLRRSLGLPEEGALGVFVGSGHPPNVVAVEALERRASAYAAGGIGVVVVGRCGLGRASVRNVVHTGEVPEVPPYLHASDVALCPLSIGSGTSLKTIEYLAAGLPLVSTDVGVRGLGLNAGVEYALAAPDEMPRAAAGLLADRERAQALASAGRAAVQRRYGWDAIGAVATAALDELVDACRASRARP
jgi:glycosyltransferase involved in cell wall biosynthesis